MQSGKPLQSAERPQATAPTVLPVADKPRSPPPVPSSAGVTAQQQRVRQLIKQVEQAYAQGQAAYRKGNLADAKSETSIAPST
jgi:hypothetical protein